MTGFKSVTELVDAELSGAKKITSFRKQPTLATGANIWFDMSMSPGNPKAQYYAAAPEVGIPLSRSTAGGIDHGEDPPGKTKYLRKLTMMATAAGGVPISMQLLDYLYYVPFLDESDTSYVAVDCTSNPMTRYTDGEGVQIMAIVVAGQTGGQTFQVTYTNSSGVSDKVTSTVTMNTQALNGTIITSAPTTYGCTGQFIPLCPGCKGVRKIQGIQFNGADVGLLTLVLVKPIANITVREVTAPVEIDYFKDFGQVPEIKADAYLNFICCPQGSLSSVPFIGIAEFIWN